MITAATSQTSGLVNLAAGPGQSELNGLAALISANRNAEAEPLARRMVETWPQHGVGWKALGVVLAAQARVEEAIPVLQKAAELLPADAETHHALGNTLQRLGRLTGAEASHRRAVELKPDYHEALNNLGAVLRALGRLPEAEACFRRVVELRPDLHQAHSNLGNALEGLGRFAEAEESNRRALELNPDNFEAHYNRGNALQALGRWPEAEASFRRAIGLNPDYHQVHHNLGAVLVDLGRAAEAEASFRRTMELKPDLHQAYINLGAVQVDLGRYADAEASCRRAIQLDPGHHEAHLNLGNALRHLGRLSGAQASYRRALVLKPDYLDAHFHLGNALQSRGRYSEAQACYRRALELKPDDHQAHNNLGGALVTLRLSEAQACFRRAMELKPDYHDAHSNLIFAVDLMEGRGIEEQQQERQRWYAQHGLRYAASIKPHRNLADPERKLRVGYVSADFRRQSACHIFGAVIRHHDRSAFEVFCYSGVKQEDEVTARLRQAAQRWRPTLGVPDEALAAQIRGDEIDILVDLSAHMAGNRLLVFARKPAPVQVTAWGYANGTGLATIDYFLADPVVLPQDERSLFAEEVVDLPCFVCYEPPEYLPEVSPLPALAGKPFTFGCINRIEKISDGALVLWGRILAALPGAGLLVKGDGIDDPKHRQHFVRRLREAGIAEQRVRLMGNSPQPEHLKIFREVDLVLDPFPHGGGISSAESLWMGVPVVTLNGTTIPGRLTASILTALQMQEWIAHSDEDYVRIAVQAARDLPRLARTREELRSRSAESVLGDVQLYTRSVESAYRAMWRRWCAGKAAGPSQGELIELASLFAASRHVEAEAAARRMIEVRPEYGIAWKALGAVLATQARLAEAVPALRKAVELLPADAETHHALGNTLQRLGLLTESEASYRRAIELEPDYHEAHYNLANALDGLDRLSEAEAGYRRAVELKPDYHEALNNLGAVLRARGRLAEAEASFRRAIELKPDLHEQYINLGAVQADLGRYADAEAGFRRAIELNPDHPEAHFNLGNALRHLARLSGAEASFRRALELKPDYCDTHFQLGNALQSLGRYSEAQACYRRAVELKPDYHDALNNLGAALRALGRSSEAEASFRRTIELRPDAFEAHYNLGNSLQALGRWPEAEASFRRAIDLNRDYCEAHHNLGAILVVRGRAAGAEASYRRAIEIAPDRPAAHNNLGNILKGIGRLRDAEASFRRAIELKPDLPEAHNNLGNVLRDLGQFDDALASVRRALAIEPDFAICRVAQAMMTLPIAPQTVTESILAPGEFGRALRHLSDWLGSMPARPAGWAEAIGEQQPFFLAYRDGNHVELLSRYGDLVAEGPGQPRFFPVAGRRKLRLAVVSQFFRHHSVWNIIVRGLLAHLDRARFEVVLYHLGNAEDGETAAARSLADLWRDFRTVAGLNGWLDAMAADLPDVILYPEIGMDAMTLRLAARRLAPLQVAAAGHPITTGLPTIDLYFSAEMLEPPEADAHYRERLVRLPGTGSCTAPIERVPEQLPELEAALALRRGARFVIAQSPFKFDPGDDALYARIAAAVGECTFILVGSNLFPWAIERLVSRLERTFSDAGLDATRYLLLIPRLSYEKFYALLDLCDIYLDCPTFSSYTTAWHAVHRGLPIVTLEGRFMRQRMAAGLLRRIGITDTVAASAEDYVAIAVRLARERRDPDRFRARRHAIGLAAPQADRDVSVVRAFEQSVIEALAQRGRQFESVTVRNRHARDDERD